MILLCKILNILTNPFSFYLKNFYMTNVVLKTTFPQFFGNYKQQNKVQQDVTAFVRENPAFEIKSG